MYLDGGITGALTKAATRSASKSFTSITTKTASTAARTATKGASTALRSAASAATKGATSAARSGIFSKLAQGAGAIAHTGGAALTAAASIAPTVLETYLALKSAEAPLLPDDATVAPMAPGQPMPGTPETVSQPAITPIFPGQPTSSGQPQATTFGLPALNVGGVNATPFLLLGGGALLLFALMQKRGKR